jgi:RNA recognition motif-containing protein
LQSTYNLSSNRIPEYDPTQASLAVQGTPSAGKRHGNQQNWSRSDNGTTRGSRARAPFSQPGPNFDQSRSTIVVEQIPEENFTEEAVKGFFSQFGNIVDVDMRAYKRLAIVKYDDYSAARRAYDSPKVIFDNRFVKVYWYKPESLPTPPAKKNDGAQDVVAPDAYKEDEEMVDTAELEKRQADAQKAFEERQKKAQEADARFEELERKLKENEEQARMLREELAKRAGKVSNGTNGFGQDDSTLIEQLSTLQAEAQNLNADYDTYSFRGRGRGAGYRGRGFAPPRGRGHYAPFRGGYRGRGYQPSPFAGGRSAVKRLDNRPKRVAVSGVEAGSLKDETLRQHLLVRLAPAPPPFYVPIRSQKV